MRRDEKVVAYNRGIHDRVAPEYDVRHGEIYNPTEQKRIRDSIEKAIWQIRTGSEVPLVLDFGSGTGNLTHHFLQLHARVVAADVSSGSLNQVNLKLGAPARLETMGLNGRDLSNIGDSTFDLVATYSVLHHIPDYLRIIDEFVRVLKTGGVVYIDHEACPSYWEVNDLYLGYLEELGERFRQTYLLDLGVFDSKKGPVSNLVTMLKRDLARGKWTGALLRKIRLIYDEGDIHNTREDHVGWEKIKTRLSGSCEVLIEKDYLVCRETSDPPPAWVKWRDRSVDMRMIVARKK